MSPPSGAVVGATAIAVTAALLFMGLLADVIRAVVGLTVLLTPGYAFLRAIVAPGVLDASRRAAIMLASGLVIVVLLGLVANQLPTGVSGPTWLFLIAGSILGLRQVAVARGYAQRRGPRQWLAWLGGHLWVTATGDPPGDPFRAVSLAPVMITTLAVMVSLGALSVARTGQLEQDRRSSFTEFWVVPVQDRPGEVSLGARSHEVATTRYTVLVRSAGTTVVFDGSFSLDPGAAWATTLTLPVGPIATPSPGGSVDPSASPEPGLASPIRATLYVVGNATPYREVWLSGSTSS